MTTKPCPPHDYIWRGWPDPTGWLECWRHECGAVREVPGALVLSGIRGSDAIESGMQSGPESTVIDRGLPISTKESDRR